MSLTSERAANSAGFDRTKALLTPRRTYFFVVSAVLMLVVVFVGFSPTFYLLGLVPETKRTVGPWYLYVHGAVMTAWYVLFVLQASLVATKRFTLHWSIGKLGVLIAMAVVLTGAYVSLKMPGRLEAVGAPPEALEGIRLGVTLGNLIRLVVFAAVFSAAILLRRKSQWHGRLMFWSFIFTVNPALASGPPPGRFWAPILGPLIPGWLPIDLAAGLAALVAYDLLKTRRVHPAILVGAGAYLLAGVALLTVLSREATRTFVLSLLP